MRTLVYTLLLLLPGLAQASPVDPSKSTFDPILVGNSSGNDMSNGFRVVCRDIGNIPLPGRVVTLHFVGSSARPYTQQDAGTTADCTAETISGITDAQGEVVFHARVGRFEDEAVDDVRANGIMLGHIQVRSTDLDGDGATDLADLNAFRERYLHDPAAPETDFNRDGTTNMLDFALLRTEYVRAAKGTVCP